ncbi:polyketide cyclase [Dietzia cinnamea]|uniref:Polyketide cyclase n=1 Tax=Dietzia cinnamea TaxID=321318 RepID=A0AAW5Q6H9_9ACTN|nr:MULTISPECIES: polyketide cyclase [Dietzia]MCT1712437.1 polyketide cyclase [Dietzia cinnamea]MCT1864156.1 polyketide cyclase [Dietzia cinnamea]MCT2028813.1 polyketide cyclase [Dietzia cinnamea]MCT2032351.1 polyketide cyclase [Dietzia cinnamea]MCT2074937.1 polyketide cyclase [Dietzia cinnamea]
MSDYASSRDATASRAATSEGAAASAGPDASAGAGGAAAEYRFEARRVIAAAADRVFAVLCDPDGHVAIDSSGMLQSAEGSVVTAEGDRFVVHMDRESLGDYDMGEYDVTVIITRFEPGAEIAWTIDGTIKPPIGHTYGYRLIPLDGGDRTEVVSYYDWADAHPDWRDSGVLPVLDASALKATLGILDRAVRRGYVRG